MAGRPQHSDATTAIGEMREAPEKLTREDVAKIELGHTDIPRWLAVAITVLFVLAIVAVPFSQAFRSGQALDIFRAGPKAAAAWNGKDGSTYDKLFAANAEALRQINDYEDALEDASWMTEAWLGPVTELQVRYFGVGNEEAYIGRDGWLFYRPDVDHVMGPGFLDRDQLARRASGGNEYTAPPQPDPRKAIIQFREQLTARGIRLIVMPTPVKPSVYPRKFSARYDPSDAPVVNASYRRFVDELEAAGVEVFDPSDILLPTQWPTYLKTDTHWSPLGARLVAMALARRVAATTAPHLNDVSASHTNTGDIAAMLELPDDQTVIAPETVEIVPANSRPSRDASVLLLGDSFTNIYSMEALGWGTGAGLGEQLGDALEQPVDVIAINAGGAHASRAALVAELARGHDRLAGKTVVIWQFAMRELSFGDWKLMDLPVAEGANAPVTEVVGDSVIATGTVAARTIPPRPGSVPYRDAVIAIQLNHVDGGNLPGELLVYTWGMRDNKLVDQPWQIGRTLRVKLVPWSIAEKQYGSYNRSELDDPDAIFLDAYWGEVIE